MAAASGETLGLCNIISESKTIINSHSLWTHFPFCICIYTSFLIILKDFHVFSSFTLPFLTNNQAQTLLQTSIHALLFIFLYLYAAATVSFNTYQRYIAQPVVDHTTTIESALKSFLPLLATGAVSLLVVALTSTPFVLLVFLDSKWLHYSYLSGFVALFIGLVLVVLLVFLQVNWILVYVVVVVESKWGYEAFRRSGYLVKGHRGTALSMVLFFGVVHGFVFWASSWGDYIFRIYNSIYQCVFVFSNCVANVVFYMYCKKLHEGVAFDHAGSINVPLLV